MKKHIELVVRGRVQGVSFRYQAKEAADISGIYGYARNMPDGSVVIEIEGEEEQLMSFIDWCKAGKTLATIKQIDTKEGEIKGYREFQIY
jgi:acylphosphatase